MVKKMLKNITCGRYAAEKHCLRLNAKTSSGDDAMLIIRIRPVLGTTILPNTNTLFGLPFGPNRIQIEYSVQPWYYSVS